MIDKNKEKKKYFKKPNIRKLDQIKKLENVKRYKRVRIEIISKIKNRSKKRYVLNEISNDMENIRLGFENLILLDFINKKISNL